MRDMKPVPRALLLIVFFLAGAVVDGLAQTQTYDIATFSPPQSWKAERRRDSFEFTHIDQAAQTYCVVGIYASTPGSASSGADFAKEWEALVRSGFSAGAAPRPSAGRTPSGLSYLEGGAAVTQGGKSSYAHLMVFAAGDRTMSILFVASSRAALGARQVTLQAFLESLRLNIGPQPSSTQGPASSLIYQVPAGWSRTERSGTVTLARVVDLGFGLKQDFRITILSPERVTGTAVDTYQALWRRMISGLFVTPFHPLPLRVRLRGGLTLLYDGEQMRLRQNNAEMDGFLYVILDGQTAVPLFASYSGWDEELDRALRQLFDSVQLRGSGGQPRPLFTPEEIAGVWRSSSSTLANWVDAAGNYRGDASVATGETLTLRADGTYESQFASISSGSRLRQHDVGRFRIEDDFLVLRPDSPDQKQSRHRITGVGRSADGRGSFLLLGITRDDFPFLSAGSTRPRAGDLYVGVR